MPSPLAPHRSLVGSPDLTPRTLPLFVGLDRVGDLDVLPCGGLVAHVGESVYVGRVAGSRFVSLDSPERFDAPTLLVAAVREALGLGQSD